MFYGKMQLYFWISLFAGVFSDQLLKTSANSAGGIAAQVAKTLRDSSQSHLVVREYVNVTLNCKAEGFPEPRITWKREDGKPFTIARRTKVNASDGEQLTLYRISRVEMGAYLCIASNGITPSVSEKIVVDVNFPPMVLVVPQQLVGAAKGTNVTLQCNIEAFPIGTTYWMYNNKVILKTDKYHTDTIEKTYETVMRLKIRNLTESDFGLYKCHSENPIGNTDGLLRLYETA